MQHSEHPCARTTGASTARASRSKASSSKIWLPMCACTPTTGGPPSEASAVERLVRRPRRHREAELRVLLPGHHVLVRVRLDPGRDPHEQARRAEVGAGLDEAAQAVDLVEGVHDDAADACPEGRLQLVRGLVVAVQHEPRARRAGCRARRRARRRWRRRGCSPPRWRARPSPCRGRPSWRTRRPARRLGPPLGSVPSGAPRRRRTAGCRARRRARRRRRRRRPGGPQR